MSKRYGDYTEADIAEFRRELEADNDPRATMARDRIAYLAMAEMAELSLEGRVPRIVFRDLGLQMTSWYSMLCRAADQWGHGPADPYMLSVVLFELIDDIEAHIGMSVSEAFDELKGLGYIDLYDVSGGRYYSLTDDAWSTDFARHGVWPGPDGQVPGHFTSSEGDEALAALDAFVAANAAAFGLGEGEASRLGGVVPASLFRPAYLAVEDSTYLDVSIVDVGGYEMPYTLELCGRGLVESERCEFGGLTCRLVRLSALPLTSALVAARDV